MTKATDGELVGLTRGGDRDAYGELVARYQGHVYALAYSLTENWAESQDIAQETFIRAYVNLDGLRDPERFPAWLRRVTFSVAMKWLKAYRPGLFQQLDGRVDLDTLEIPDFRPGPPEVVEKRELARAVQGAIGELPAKYRVPLTMFHLDGLSYQKVADFLDIPLGTAKSLIHRARAKLKGALAGYASEEVTPMVQEVFDEHRLPEEFAQKVLDNVPTLGWGTGRECTFAGALEAALTPTDHPYRYSDLLGFTGLAFRTRWFCGDDGARWCPSCAVGEMEEEIAAVEKATGWPLRVHFLQGDDVANVEQTRTDIVKSIDEGRAVLAYEPELNMDVVYGYEQGGKMLLLRDYAKGEEPLRLSPSKLGFLMLFIGDRGEAMSRREAIIESLRIAARNWRRERGHAGPGEYWYGRAALEHWMADIEGAEELSEEDLDQLRSVTWWNFTTIHDARKTAVTYLREIAEELGGEAVEALGRAADIYAEEVKLFDAAAAEPQVFIGSAEGWTDDAGRREREVLTRAIELEEKAIAEIERVLEQLPADG
jgi:RNA polymerase sigma-70 factor (ECF subfamily)